MHPELSALVDYCLSFAVKRTAETGESPLFPAILDETGKSTFLNVHIHEEWERRPESVAAMVEFLRVAVKETGTTGAVICSPILLSMESGITQKGFQLHADHYREQQAYRITVPIEVDIGNQVVRRGNTVTERVDDLLVDRV